MFKNVLKEEFEFDGVVHDFTLTCWGHNFYIHKSNVAGHISIHAISQEAICKGDAFVYVNTSSKQVWGVVSTEPRRSKNPSDSFYFDIEVKGHVNKVDDDENNSSVDNVERLEDELEKLKVETYCFKLLTNKFFLNDNNRNPIEESIRSLHNYAENFSKCEFGTIYTNSLDATKKTVFGLFEKFGDKLSSIVDDFEKELADEHCNGMRVLAKMKEKKIIEYVNRGEKNEV